MAIKKHSISDVLLTINRPRILPIAIPGSAASSVYIANAQGNCIAIPFLCRMLQLAIIT